MLIDESYFSEQLLIAQLGQQSVVDNLRGFIRRYESIVMEAALGYDFYQVFLTGLTGSPTQRWIDLRDGVLFTDVNLIRKRFVGFGNNTTKISPLAGFIYYEYMKDMASSNTGIGLVVDNSENASTGNPVRKPVNAFNDAAYQVRSFWELMQADQTKTVKVYPEFKPNDVFEYIRYVNQLQFFVNGQVSESYSFRTKNTFGI